MDKNIENLINSKSFLLYGVSENKTKFGNAIYKELTSKGIKIYPIYSKNIENIETYDNVNLLPEKPVSAIICTKPNNTLSILNEIHSFGIKNVWLQQGSDSPEVIKKAKELELNYVNGKCIIMYMEPKNPIHKFHRAIVKLFGKY